MPTSKDLSDLDSQLKKKVISAKGFKRGSSLDFSKSLVNIHKTLGTLAGFTKKLVIRVNDLEKTVNNNFRKITSLKNISKTQSERISGTNLGAKLPGGSTSNVEDNIATISKSVSSIAEILSGRKKLLSDTVAYEKRKEEQDKRALAESKLEKRFEGLKRTAEKIIAPVKSLLDKIIDFFVTIFLGRIVYKLLEWFGNKENADKVRSVIRFLGDHWTKLLALYLTFGTSFGKFSRGLIKVVARGAFLLAGAIARLKGARKAARFLGGRGGRLASAVIGTAVTLGGTYAATQALKGSDEEPKAPEQKAQGLAGGGLVIPRFSGGGFNFKGMLGGAGLGSMFGPLGMLFGAGAGAMSGFVSGEKGVDKVPAMLSDGEFVMSTGAVAKYGVDTLEAMNAAGGGTNKPKIMSGTTYASGGGLVGDSDANGMYSGGLIADRKEQLSQEAISARLKRIEAQMQVQQALASGRGLNIKGASYGANLGKGFATKYQGRDAIVIKNGVDFDTYSTGIADNEITLGGRVYYAVKRGNDLIYVSNFKKGLAGQTDKYGARNKSYKGKGGGLMSGLSSKDKKNLPKTKIMMGPDGPFVGYLTYKNGEPSYQRPTQRKKGMLESLADFFNPKGAKAREETLNARTLRITGISDLEDMRRRGMKEENIKKMLNERLGANGYSRAVNDAKAKQARINKEASQKNLDRLTWGNVGPDMMPKRFAAEQEAGRREYDRRGGFLGQMGRWSQRAFGGAEANRRLDAQAKFSEAKSKQSGAAAIGRYYSSSDGKYYANYAAAEKARDARRAKLASQQKTRTGVKPPVKPKPKYVPAGGGMGGKRGKSSRDSARSIPSFNARNPSGMGSKIKTLGMII